MGAFRKVYTRQLHYWAALLVGVQLLIVITSGLLLQVKKQVDWVQPPTQDGVGSKPEIDFERILQAASQPSEPGFRNWSDIDRLDVRPGSGMVKVLGKNRWEVQVDIVTGEVLQVAYRRSDLIEAIHDGSWFHSYAKTWLFLPSGIVFLLMWTTGVYMFFSTWLTKRRGQRIKTRIKELLKS